MLPNIGLINSLACYARINQYGFVEAPFRRIDKSDPANPVVTNEVRYMTADEEDNYHVAQASEPLDAEGHFVHRNVSGRYRELTQAWDRRVFDYMDVSPKMVFSVATSLIPFLQNDDANRALMGSNMQRQAVPLLTTEAPAVGTGMEEKAAVDSGVCVLAKHAGTVSSVTSTDILVTLDDGTVDKYHLTKYMRSNQSNCYNQKPIVSKGERVEEGEVIADGPSTSGGELALGKNPLIGFMTWEGYNYEDAVLLSERLVRDDVYTSVHIEEYEAQSRDTKLGPEEITRDVPGVGDEALKDLDDRGIIRIARSSARRSARSAIPLLRCLTASTVSSWTRRSSRERTATSCRPASIRACGSTSRRSVRFRSATRWPDGTETRVSSHACFRSRICRIFRTGVRSTSC